MFSGRFEDRLEVRELIDSYASAVMRHDAEAWAATWAEQGIWQLRGHRIEGRAAIRTHWEAAMRNFHLVTFLAMPGSMDLSGEEGQLLTHTFEQLVPVDGPPRFQSGLYTDRVVRVDGRWLFAERRFQPQGGM